jgi:hypothetical protein
VISTIRFDFFAFEKMGRGALTHSTKSVYLVRRSLHATADTAMPNWLDAGAGSLRCAFSEASYAVSIWISPSDGPNPFKYRVEVSNTDGTVLRSRHGTATTQDSAKVIALANAGEMMRG